MPGLRRGSPARSPARDAGTLHLQRLRIIELLAAPADRVRRDLHRLGHDPHAALAQLTRLDTQPEPALTLTQMRPDRVVTADQRLHHRAHSRP